MPDARGVPWRDFDPWDEFGGDNIPEHVQDMRYVHKFAAKKTAHEPKDVTDRLAPYRDMRNNEPTRFLTQYLAAEKEIADKAEIALAREAKPEHRGPNDDTAHCLALVEKLIGEWHAKHPGPLEKAS